MPKLIKPIKPITTAPSKSNVRVALVQIDYNPAYRFKIDYICEPLGIDTTNDTAVSNIRLLDRGMEEVIRGAVNEVRANYLSHLKSKIHQILDFLSEMDLDLVCFPEYSIPAELIPDILPYAKYFGLVLPSHTCTNVSLKVLSEIFDTTLISWTPGHSLYVAVPHNIDAEAYLLGKVTRSKFEPSLTMAEETSLLPLVGMNSSVLVLMCSDFVQGRDSSAAVRSRNPAVQYLGQASLRVVCALTPSTGPFFDLATTDLLRSFSMERRPTAFVNHMKEGGTSIFALMEAEQVLESRDEYSSYRIPAGVEAVAVYDVAIGPQLVVKPSPYTPEPLSKLTNLHVLQDPDGLTMPSTGELAQQLATKLGIATGVANNIRTALELIGEVAGDEVYKRFEPLKFKRESSTLAWRSNATSQLCQALRSLIPSLETQDRQIIEPRLRSLEALGEITEPVPSLTAQSSQKASLSKASRTSEIETEYEEYDEQGQKLLTSVLKLNSLPRFADPVDLVGPIWSLLAIIIKEPKLTLEISYEIIRLAELGASVILTEFSIEMLILIRYKLQLADDTVRAKTMLRDIRLLFQTGFGNLYRFVPVSQALVNTYRDSQIMNYRIRAGHRGTIQNKQIHLAPYRSYPRIANVLRFLFSRGQRARLKLTFSSFNGKEDLYTWEPIIPSTNPSIPSSSNLNESLSKVIREMDFLQVLRPQGLEKPEYSVCNLALILELSEAASEVVPEVVFRELLSDSFALQSEKKVGESWIADETITSDTLYDPVSLRECLTLLQFPLGPIPSYGDLTSTSALQVPFEVAENVQGCLIGHAFHSDLPESIPVHLSDEDRRKHLYVIGKTGTGKTQFLLNMIMQDIEAGNGVCVMDPHGDLFEDVLSRFPTRRLRDLVIFDPTDSANPPGLNLFEHDRRDPLHRDFVLDEAVSIFLRLHGNEMFGPRIQNYFRNGALALMSDPSRERSLIDMGRLFLDDDFFNYIMNTSKDPAVEDFITEFKKTAEREKSEMIPYFQAKFAPFVSNVSIRNVIGQPRSTVNFRQAMDLKRVVLVNLSKGKLGELNSKLLGMVMVSKVTWAALTRAHLSPDQRSDFYLYCDEFQNFATDTFSTVLSEARKYGLCLTLAHQYLSQLRINDNFTMAGRDSLRDAVLGNAGNVVVFRVGANDAENLVKEIAADISSESVTALLSTQPRFRAVVRLDCGGRPTHAFTLQTSLTNVVEDKERSAMLRSYVVNQVLFPREFVLADIASSRLDYKADGDYISEEVLKEEVTEELG